MYHILPFNFKRIDDVFLLVNECGDFIFLSHDDFNLFINHSLDEHCDIFYNLESKLFATCGNLDLPVRKTAARYRSKKEFLRNFTSLHMLVITLRCNQRCKYCQVSCADEDASKYDMSVETARKVVDFIFTSPTRNPKIEFQGGEPTLNWDAIVAVVEKAEHLALEQEKKVEFVICTNLTRITLDQLYYCKDHNIQISTSLDGPEHIHNSCRLAKNGQGTYKDFLNNLDIARNIIGEDNISALMTTSSMSLEHLKDIVDEYIKLGMNSIFIRALNPYGFASEQVDILGYSIDRYVECYIDALHYIFEINKRIYFPEFFATLLFSRILTSFSTGFVDLQSPSGAGISGAIYDYEGSVFPADEARMIARMGDRHFCLGNVNMNSWQDIFSGKQQRNITLNSCVETTFPCFYCAFKVYCGTDPIRNYLESGIEFRNMSSTSFCIKHNLIFTHLFSFIRKSNDIEKDIIWSWITGNRKLLCYEDN